MLQSAVGERVKRWDELLDGDHIELLVVQSQP